MNQAILLVNMGGPSDLKEIKSYMRQIMRDPFILPVPGLLRLLLAELIVARRSQKVAERYKLIGGGSPLLFWTEQLAKNIERIHPKEPDSKLSVNYCFRYSSPTLRETFKDLKSRHISTVKLIPLFPHYTRAMTGSIEKSARLNADKYGINIEIVPAWGQHPKIIELQKSYLLESLNKASSNARVIFIAHGIPIRDVKRGDPYTIQVEQTAEILSKSLPQGNPWTLAYQSKLGPVKWTEPYLEDVLEYSINKREPVVLMPLSFVADCLETLYDLDIIAKKKLVDAGIESHRVRVFNDDPNFARIILEIINGR